jgi:predicted transcriptional regulator
MKLSSILAKTRRQTDISLRNLSEKSGIDWGDIGKYEREEKPLQFSIFEKLMESLGYRVEIKLSEIAVLS